MQPTVHLIFWNIERILSFSKGSTSLSGSVTVSVCFCWFLTLAFLTVLVTHDLTHYMPAPRSIYPSGIIRAAQVKARVIRPLPSQMFSNRNSFNLKTCFDLFQGKQTLLFEFFFFFPICSHFISAKSRLFGAPRRTNCVEFLFCPKWAKSVSSSENGSPTVEKQVCLTSSISSKKLQKRLAMPRLAGPSHTLQVR